MKTFIVCERGAIDPEHVIAVISDDYDRRIVVTDTGTVIGIPENMYRKLLSSAMKTTINNVIEGGEPSRETKFELNRTSDQRQYFKEEA